MADAPTLVTDASSVAIGPASRARHLAAAGGRTVEGMLWVGPAFLYLAFFIAYPFPMSLYLSVSSARVGSPEWHFVGLTNYTRLFQDPVYHVTTGYPAPVTAASDEVYQQFVLIDAVAQFCTDKMDLDQTMHRAEDKLMGI